MKTITQAVQIDFVSVLLFLGMGQCLFLLLSMLIGKSRKVLANWLLSALLLAFLWYQFEFFLIRHTLDAQVPFLYGTRYGSWLLVGPLILLYNRAILIKDFTLKKKDVLHFLPFLLFTILLPLSFDDFITKRSVDYGMLTVFDSFNREVITAKHYLYAYLFLLQFIHALVYIFLAYKETNQLITVAKQQQSNLITGKVNTLRYLYLGAIVIIFLCSAFVTYIFATTMWKRNFDYFYVLPTLIFVFGLAYRAMKYPNTVLALQEEIKQVKYAKSSLAESAKKAYLKILEEKIEVDKLYRNNELRLADLAKAMEISTHHLSQIINEEKNKNFFDYINSYRVAEAKEKIAQESSQTLLQIAYSVGFNSKNSFNSAFKKHVGMTPSAYKKKTSG